MRLTENLDSQGEEANWEELKEQLDVLRENANEIKEASNNQDLDFWKIHDLAQDGNTIGNRVKETLEVYLQENPLSEDFQNEAYGLSRTIEECNHALQGIVDNNKLEAVRENLASNIDSVLFKIDLYKAVLDNSDLIIDPKHAANQNELRAEEKERILLERLYSVNQQINAKIPASWILEGNGIDVDRTKKHEMCKALEEKGFIHNDASKDGCFIKISHEGEKEVESKGEEGSTSKEVQQLKDRIEEIKEELKSKVGEEAEFTRCGLEVLFEELEKIKGQADDQNRDTLRQIIWGKFKEMFDSKTVAKEFLKIAYERLTEELPKLPNGLA